MRVRDLINWLVAILTAASLPPALRPLSVKYPARQIRGRELLDGTVEVTVYHRYKKHGSPMPIDSEGIKKALHDRLPVSYIVDSVTDCGTHIIIFFKGV